MISEYLSDELESAYRDDFMKPQITSFSQWLKSDTINGTDYFPMDGMNFDAAVDMYEVDADECEVVSGYGARLSANGYLDCTEWSVFDSPDEAAQYLLDMA